MYTKNRVLSKATPPILIGLHIGHLEMEERLKLHLSHIDNFMIQSELGYLIEEKAFTSGTGETHWAKSWGWFFRQ
jgi:hypothetical protein